MTAAGLQYPGASVQGSPPAFATAGVTVLRQAQVSGSIRTPSLGIFDFTAAPGVFGQYRALTVPG